MNKKTAERVLRIMLEADGGCYYCARQLFQLFVKEFPDQKDVAERVYFERHEEGVYEEDGDHK